MRFQHLADILLLDRPLVYAMAARIWQAMSGPVTIIFLIASLSTAETGIYYAIVSILGIQMFFELGLLNILVSRAGHFAASLESPAGLQGMRELIRSAQRWFAMAAALFAVAALLFGWNTLIRTNANIDWRLPLIVIVVIAALTVAISPFLAILEGAGFRQDVYRIRLLQMTSGSLVVWLALGLGLKLWALVLASAVQLLWSAYLAFVYHAGFFARFRARLAIGQRDPSVTEFSWTRDVVPIQWRYALISGVYHLATQFFTVIVVRYHSDVLAGRLGMTLSVTAAIQSMALAWVNTKFSIVSAQHGSGNREAAGTLWRRTAVVSSGLLLIGLGGAGLVLLLLPWAGQGLEQRFIEPWQFLLLAVGCLANHGIALQGFYVLSRGARPFLVPSLVGFTCTAIGVWGGGYLYATSGIVIAYALTMLCITLPWHTLAYVRFRRQGQVAI